MAKRLHRLLSKHSAWITFRRKQLPSLFNIPADIQKIALASRARPHRHLLDSSTLNTVWSNETAFRQCAKENPKLLIVLNLFANALDLKNRQTLRDPIQQLKLHLRTLNVSEAGWKYLVKHGTRIIRPAWQLPYKQSPKEIFIHVMHMLQDAGLPQSVPPSVMQAFLRSYTDQQNGLREISASFHNLIDRGALQSALFTAHENRRSNNLSEFSENMTRVFLWTEQRESSLPKDLIKQGWEAIVKRWRIAENLHTLLEATPELHWSPKQVSFETHGYQVKGISSLKEIVQAAAKLRNCLTNYLEACADQYMEIYLLITPSTSRLKGCIGISYENELPSIIDIKGVANTRANPEMYRAAEELLKRLTIKNQPKLGGDV